MTIAGLKCLLIEIRLRIHFILYLIFEAFKLHITSGLDDLLMKIHTAVNVQNLFF